MALFNIETLYKAELYIHYILLFISFILSKPLRFFTDSKGSAGLFEAYNTVSAFLTFKHLIF